MYKKLADVTIHFLFRFLKSNLRNYNIKYIINTWYFTLSILVVIPIRPLTTITLTFDDKIFHKTF